MVQPGHLGALFELNQWKPPGKPKLACLRLPFKIRPKAQPQTLHYLNEISQNNISNSNRAKGTSEMNVALIPPIGLVFPFTYQGNCAERGHLQRVAFCRTPTISHAQPPQLRRPIRIGYNFGQRASGMGWLPLTCCMR